MNAKGPTSRITRRAAMGVLLTGASLPAAAASVQTDSKGAWSLVVQDAAVTVTTCSGVSFTAQLESELRISPRGSARGFLYFGFGDGDELEYVAERGGLDVDTAGAVIRAWVLMRERRIDGRLAQDYLLGSIKPSASQDRVICDLLGSRLHPEPVRFDVPGRIEIRER